MATKPMRTATGRGQNREATIKAKVGVSLEGLKRAKENRAGPNLVNRMDKVRQATNSIAKDSARIKKAGERMARAQAYAKAKRGK